MIIYNFKKLLKVKGIEKPHTFFVKAGFSGSFATKVINNRVRRLELNEIERLCLLFRCTPNDFYEWIPSNDEALDTTHPLNKIKKSERTVNITKLINDIPINKLEEIEKLIAENLKEDL